MCVYVGKTYKEGLVLCTGLGTHHAFPEDEGGSLEYEKHCSRDSGLENVKGLFPGLSSAPRPFGGPILDVFRFSISADSGSHTVDLPAGQNKPTGC